MNPEIAADHTNKLQQFGIPQEAKNLLMTSLNVENEDLKERITFKNYENKNYLVIDIGGEAHEFEIVGKRNGKNISTFNNNFDDVENKRKKPNAEAMSVNLEFRSKEPVEVAMYEGQLGTYKLTGETMETKTLNREIMEILLKNIAEDYIESIKKTAGYSRGR